MIVDTPILKLYYFTGYYKCGLLKLCRNNLRKYFEIDFCNFISVRISDTPSRGSIAVRFRYRYDNGLYYPECRVVGWHKDWHDFTNFTDKWLEKNIPVLARLKKSTAKKPRSILLHVTIYTYE